MEPLSTFSEFESRADAWLESHRLTWFVLLVAFLTAFRLLLAVLVFGEPALEGLTDGLSFAVPFSIAYFLFRGLFSRA